MEIGAAAGLLHFDGTIDELRIWNVCRKAAEVCRDFHRLVDGDQSGLVGYWRFDEGRGEQIVYSSLYGHDGSLGEIGDPVGEGS